MRYLFGFMCVLALGLMGCGQGLGPVGGAGGGGVGGDGGNGGMPECETPEDCDDGNSCTDDACTDGTCEHTPVEDGRACADDAGTCQQGSCRVACDEQGIRDAIAAGGGPYTFDCGDGMTVVIQAPIEIDKDVILDGEGKLTVDGNDTHIVFFVEPEPGTVKLRVELRRMTVSGGRDAGIDNEGGTLSLVGVTVSNNRCVPLDGRCSGGGIANNSRNGALMLTNSTVSGNTAWAGAIRNGGTMTITNSTVSGNNSGIDNRGTLTLVSSTVSGNDVGDGAHVAFINGDYSPVTLTSSLIDGDCYSPVVSNGYNIESPGDTCGFDPDGTDLVDVTEGELNLGPLQDNEGPTMTHALGAGSFAIDKIPEADCEVDTDQRGFPRDSMCDVGAFEVQP